MILKDKHSENASVPGQVQKIQSRAGADCRLLHAAESSPHYGRPTPT